MDTAVANSPAIVNGVEVPPTAADLELEKVRHQMAFTEEVYRVSATIVTITLFMLFIVYIVRIILANKLRQKILEKGVSQENITSLMDLSSNKGSKSDLRWVYLLAALGLGLAIVSNYQPIGIHSIAIMCFCLAAGFLANHFFGGKRE